MLGSDQLIVEEDHMSAVDQSELTSVTACDVIRKPECEQTASDATVDVAMVTGSVLLLVSIKVTNTFLSVEEEKLVTIKIIFMQNDRKRSKI